MSEQGPNSLSNLEIQNYLKYFSPRGLIVTPGPVQFDALRLLQSPHCGSSGLVQEERDLAEIFSRTQPSQLYRLSRLRLELSDHSAPEEQIIIIIIIIIIL